jgi:glycosyltransferase involved in cell wall biosynthesis
VQIEQPNDPKTGNRVAIISTHPIQYYAPWFRWIAANSSLEIKVFYLWDFGTTPQRDPGFAQEIRWDIPLLDGYEYEFVPNVSPAPGTHHFFGLQNPELLRRLKNFFPNCALLIGYNYASLLRLIITPEKYRGFPLMMRGDSHRLHSATGGVADLIRRAVISQLFRRFSAMLYVGDANYDYFKMHGVPERKLFSSPHAVDNGRFQAEPERVRAEARAWRRRLGIPDHDLLILFAGKFEEKKRPLDLLAAFKAMGPRDVSLLFVGAGEQESELRQAAAGQSGVFFAPFQNQSEMPRTYAACDLFVLPSFGAEETWGLAINEALCLSRPVIVSDHVGCGPDLVRPWENGLIFRAGDIDALAAALKEALSDPVRLREWGAAGRKIVDRYDFAAASHGLIEALDALRSRREVLDQKWKSD